MEKEEDLGSELPPSDGCIEADQSPETTLPMSKIPPSAPTQKDPPTSVSTKRHRSASSAPRQVFISPKVGTNPTEMICPHCRARIVTKVDYSVGMKTHLMAGVMCICGCLILCSYIPYLINFAKVPLHYCPLCKEFLGSYDNC